MLEARVQVNAVIPYDLTSGMTYQMLIQRQRSIWLPQPVAIAPAQPAIFTKECGPEEARPSP